MSVSNRYSSNFVIKKMMSRTLLGHAEHQKHISKMEFSSRLNMI